MKNIFIRLIITSLLLAGSFGPARADDDKVTGGYLAVQAQLLVSAGQADRARPLAEKALRQTLRADGLADIALSDLYLLLGRVHLALEDYEAASRFARMAFSMKEDILGPDHGNLAESVGLLADIYDRMNMTEKAHVLHERENEIRNRMCDTRSETSGALAHVKLPGGPYR